MKLLANVNENAAAGENGEAEAAALNSSVFFFIVLVTILLGYWIRQTKFKFATEVRAAQAQRGAGEGKEGGGRGLEGAGWGEGESVAGEVSANGGVRCNGRNAAWQLLACVGWLAHMLALLLSIIVNVRTRTPARA